MHRHNIPDTLDTTTCKRSAAMRLIADGARMRRRAGAAVAIVLAATGLAAMAGIFALFIE